jgi:hypothetical protein
MTEETVKITVTLVTKDMMEKVMIMEAKLGEIELAQDATKQIMNTTTSFPHAGNELDLLCGLSHLDSTLDSSRSELVQHHERVTPVDNRR